MSNFLKVLTNGEWQIERKYELLLDGCERRDTVPGA